MPAMSGWAERMGAGLQALDAALSRPAAAVAALLPRRMRRLVEKLSTGRGRPFGQYAAAGFLAAVCLYGLTLGGHLGRLGNAALSAAGFGIARIDITGHAETAELDVLMALDLDGAALPTFGAAAARERVARLPWVADVSVRKLYPGTLQVAIVERTPFALWQNDGKISLIDREGRPIVELDDPRFADLPLVVGAGAGAQAEAFLAALGSHPELAERTRAGVLVAGRRWNLVLDNGITVKLPEGDIAPAMARLAELAESDDLFRREVSEIDLRLPDRVSVRLPKEAAEARLAAIEAEAARLARAAVRP